MKQSTIKRFEDLPSDWREIINEMSEEGAHKSEIIKRLRITASVHATLMSRFPEYHDAIEEGNDLAEAFYHEKLRTNLENRNFNNTLLIFYFKARFGFNDQAPQAKSGGALMPDKYSEKELEEKYKKREELQ